MGYVVSDGKNHVEFATLDEAVAHRKDLPMTILRKDELGNLHKVPLKDISAAVQRKEYAAPPSDSDPAMVELARKEPIARQRTSTTLMLLLFGVGMLAAIALVWWVLR